MTETAFPIGKLAESYRAKLREEIEELGKPLTLCGLLAEKAKQPSVAYAEYTAKGCEGTGVQFDLRRVPRLRFEDEIKRANEDPDVHGIMTYYPIFGTGQDHYLKDRIHHSKDVEGLSSFWINRLYSDVRTIEGEKKAIVPCTPLAILKVLASIGDAKRDQLPFEGKVVSIFNRSEVVGRPLASMLAHDGATVFIRCGYHRGAEQVF
jgi:methylenetetrahydrofolate dehydrogenase (NADP+)/methenyltetrahydrofolate cyclohydrolase